jgi:hypothetical protein
MVRLSPQLTCCSCSCSCCCCCRCCCCRCWCWCWCCSPRLLSYPGSRCPALDGSGATASWSSGDSRRGNDDAYVATASYIGSSSCGAALRASLSAYAPPSSSLFRPMLRTCRALFPSWNGGLATRPSAFIPLFLCPAFLMHS